MIIFLYGQESFLSQQKLNELVQKYKQKHQSGLNFELFDFGTGGFTEIFSRLRVFLDACSMFDEKKLAVLENIFSLNKDDQEKVLPLLQSEGLKADREKFVILRENGEPDKRSRLFKTLNKEDVQVQDFKKLSPVRLRQWVLSRIKERGGKITDQILDQWLSSLGDDLWLISNEINKLISFNPEISQKSINELADAKLKLNIFETIEAISSGQRQKAWSLVGKHFKQGEDPSYLFSMIVYQFRNLAMVGSFLQEGLSQGQIANQAKIHPFVVKKSLWQLKKVGLDKIKQIFNVLSELEIKIKIGLVEPKTALDLLIASS